VSGRSSSRESSSRGSSSSSTNSSSNDSSDSDDSDGTSPSDIDLNASVGGRSLGRGLSRVHPGSLFRHEAIEAFSRAKVDGRIVNLMEQWPRWELLLVIVTIAVVALFSSLVRVYEWTEGVALVRMSGRTDLTALAAGSVSSIEVRAGQQVERGQLLVRFSAKDEQRELDKAETELETQLVALLRNPSDDALRKELASLTARKQLAAAHVAERSLRSPCSGTVTELRIRPQQLLAAGDIVLTLADDHMRPQMVAFLPGAARPELRVGDVIRFQPEHFEFAYQSLTIESIGDEALGPSEVRRFLGPELSDAIAVKGSSVIVTASIPSDSFSTGEKRYLYSHGLPGQAWTRLRARTVLETLRMELERLLQANGDKETKQQ
jgi:membrane fusion protein (multidrug efflux system)